MPIQIPVFRNIKNEATFFISTLPPTAADGILYVRADLMN